MYSEGYEKSGASKVWATPKTDRLQVDYLSIMLLLPDMRAYYIEDDARWRMLGFNDKLFVDLTKERVGYQWFEQSRDLWLKWASEGSIYERIPDEMGFLTLRKKGQTTYISQTHNLKFIMVCDDSEPGAYPPCKVESGYKPGLMLTYSFSIKYKDRWREIDRGLKALFEHFESAALEKGAY